MKIAILTDAWLPQTNGVVTTMLHVVENLKLLGHDVLVISPSDFRQSRFMPYPDVRIAYPKLSKLEKMIRDFNPDYIHIVTEFTIGILGAYLCHKQGWRYTTSYHTKFPEYLKDHARIPLSIGYWMMKRFHKNSYRVLVATDSLKKDLDSRGFTNTSLWGRGVDQKLFRPREHNTKEYPDEHRPISMYVGRVSFEKNIEAFLKTEIPGTKYVVGDGPVLASLKAKYPNAIYKGMLKGEKLAEAYANADVFVFPSKTDTYGLVLLEALASGVPVAAYNVTGPKDIILSKDIGSLSDKEDLTDSILDCLAIKDKSPCRKYAEQYSWEECAKKFVSNLMEILEIV